MNRCHENSYNCDWISVNDKLPDFCHEVMFVIEMYGFQGIVYKRDIVCGHREESGWNVCYLLFSYSLTKDESKLKVTHWMELPEMPHE